MPSSTILEAVYDKVGGRLTFLNKVAKSHDMLRKCEEICTAEKTWFLNQCWILGEEMDDDVMDQQKYAVCAICPIPPSVLILLYRLPLDFSQASAVKNSTQLSSQDTHSHTSNPHSNTSSKSAAMVLAKALVDLESHMSTTYSPSRGHILPEIPLHKARQIMTRADFIKDYDHDNLFTIDSLANVRADSVPMMNAFREICREEGFDGYLEATLDRISAIESLGRTRELTIKDLWDGGRYEVAKGGKERDGSAVVTMVAVPGKKEDEDGEEQKDGDR